MHCTIILKQETKLVYPVAHLGFDLMLDGKFFIDMDVKHIFLSTDVTVDASNLIPDLSIPVEVTINTWLIGLGFGMKF